MNLFARDSRVLLAASSPKGAAIQSQRCELKQHPRVARSSNPLGYTHDSSGCVHRLAKTSSRIGNSPRIRIVIGD